MVIDIFQLVHLYDTGELDDDTIVLHYGQEVLDRIVHILSDPFEQVLGG